MTYKKRARKEYVIKRARPSFMRKYGANGKRKIKELKGLKGEGERTFYHVTTVEDLEGIIKEGLVPYEPYEEPHEESAVYLWDRYEDAKRFAEYKYEEVEEGEPYAILEVKLPPGARKVRREIRSPEIKEAGFTVEYLVRGRIPKKNLKIKFIPEIDTENFRRLERKLRKAGLLEAK